MRQMLVIAVALVGCIVAMVQSPVAAAAYPDHVIKMIVPFPPGSATDGVARNIAEALRHNLGQSVIVENQPGADGIIASQFVKRADPDGYTLLVSTSSAHGANKSLYRSLPYDPEKDFVPVAGLITIPLLLLVKKDFPASDVAGFVAVAKQRADKKPISFGSGNTSSRVAADLLKVSTNIDSIDVPYRGTPQALQDLVAGQIDAIITDPYSSMGFLKGGQIKALAVTDSARQPLLPEVPTMAEAGYKSVEVVTWAALFAPAKTDPAIVEKLNEAINIDLAKPETRKSIERMGMTPMVMKPDELRNFVSSEIPRWGNLVGLAGIPKK